MEFLRQIFLAVLVLCWLPRTGLALPEGWDGVISGGITSPLVTSEADEENLSGELIFQLSRTWDLSEKWSVQTLGVLQFKRETAERDFNLTNKGTVGAIIRYQFECCGAVSSGLRYTYEKQVSSGLETTGLQFGFDHAVWKKVAGEWSAPRVVSGWSNIRFSGSLGGEFGDWVAQGRYEISQGLEARPFKAKPSIYSGVGFTLDREGLSYNNKLVLDVGARLSWVIGETSVSLDIRLLRDRRFKSDELFVGRQIRLGFRRVF
ncbi:MAG: hypothetical protein AAF826_05910 [Pseudomonadota bacterium]